MSQRGSRTGATPRWTIEQLRRVRPALAEQLEARGGAVSGCTAQPDTAAPVARWSAARPTDVEWPGEGVVRLPSRTEARVALRLLAEVAAEPGARLYRQVRVPLLSIAAARRGVPLYLTVDFVLVHADGREEWIDAKTRRRSREWIRGRAAAEAWLGADVAEVDR